MAKRERATRRLTAPEPANPNTASAGASAAKAPSPEYWEGYHAGREKAAHIEKRTAEMRADRVALANQSIMVEIGDGAVLLRDGLGRAISRSPFTSCSLNSDSRHTAAEGNWKGALAHEMAVRGTTDIFVRFSEHALITILQERDRRKAQHDAVWSPAQPILSVDEKSVPINTCREELTQR